MLQFDEATTKLLDDAYQGGDITRRRRASLDALNPRPGDTIIDLGCGNGLQTQELSRAVGPEGRVVALDPSPDMLASARHRCAGRSNVTFVQATAQDTGLLRESADGAVSLQVFEYLDDLDTPLAELHRVLRPGGRIAIGDMAWDSLVWFSDHPDRMALMTRAWARHIARADVPQVLAIHLATAGFTRCRPVAVPFLDSDLRPDGLAMMLIHLMTRYAVQNELVDEETVNAWAREQQELASQGRFFFSLLHVVWTARKP